MNLHSVKKGLRKSFSIRRPFDTAGKLLTTKVRLSSAPKLVHRSPYLFFRLAFRMARKNLGKWESYSSQTSRLSLFLSRKLRLLQPFQSLGWNRVNYHFIKKVGWLKKSPCRDLPEGSSAPTILLTSCYLRWYHWLIYIWTSAPCLIGQNALSAKPSTEVLWVRKVLSQSLPRCCQSRCAYFFSVANHFAKKIQPF